MIWRFSLDRPKDVGRAVLVPMARRPIVLGAKDQGLVGRVVTVRLLAVLQDLVAVPRVVRPRCWFGGWKN
jgi:hypothetical protein